MTHLAQYIEAAERVNTRRSYASAIRHFEIEWKGLLPSTADAEGFSADLAKAQEAVHAADQRAAAAERRALLEIEQDRQARAKADKQVESLRAQVSAVETRERQVALEHAEAIVRLQAKCDTALSAEKRLQEANQTPEQELRVLHDQLLASQQEATRYRAEAQTVQTLLDRLSVSASPPPKPVGRRRPDDVTV